MPVHERLHALDATRGFALLAGVVLHCAMSFLPGFEITGLPIVDNSPSVFLGVLFFVIHMFRMTLFFVIAGFFGRMLLERDGTRKFIRNRACRILLPLVVFWFIVFPPIVVAFVWATWKRYGRLDPPISEPPENPTLLAFPLTHLWFLYVLLLLYGTAIASRWLMDKCFDRSGRLRILIDRALRWLLQSHVATVVLALPLCLNLSLSPQWSPWFGVPTPDQSLIPNLSASIAFATAFSLGWLLERQSDLIPIWERRYAIHLALAIALTIACLALIGMQPYYANLADTWRRAIYAACYSIGIWSWTFALFGIALKTCSGHSAVRRYLADASYWIYLLHMPLVFLLQTALQDIPLHWTIKFTIIFGTTMAMLLISYHWLVRPTWIGQWLNGRRYPRTVVATPTLTVGA